MARLRPQLTYANVMVTLLAFVVLCGGSAYAVGKLGKNSVGTKQLKKDSVTGAKVKNGTLRPGDFAVGAIPAGAPGPAGPSGAGPAYQAGGEVNYDKFSSSLFGSTVVTLPVPVGSYFVTASVQVQTVNGVETTVQCRLINGLGGAASSAVQRTQAVPKDGEPYGFTLTALFQVGAGQSLYLQCSKAAAGSSARVNSANIVAVQTTSISGRPEP